MLIMSQDKTLLINFNNAMGIAVNDNAIAISINGNIVTIAAYNTEEKAMQILDEIMQSYIKRLKTYQMPAESVKK